MGVGIGLNNDDAKTLLPLLAGWLWVGITEPVHVRIIRNRKSLVIGRCRRARAMDKSQDDRRRVIPVINGIVVDHK